jgi:hypothetical protein
MASKNPHGGMRVSVRLTFVSPFGSAPASPPGLVAYHHVAASRPVSMTRFAL